jgi:hypothetical protein
MIENRGYKMTDIHILSELEMNQLDFIYREEEHVKDIKIYEILIKSSINVLSELKKRDPKFNTDNDILLQALECLLEKVIKYNMLIKAIYDDIDKTNNVIGNCITRGYIDENDLNNLKFNILQNFNVCDIK